MGGFLIYNWPWKIMQIHIVSVGKKNSKELAVLIQKYQSRLAKSYLVQWDIIKHSPLPRELAIDKESSDILNKIPPKAAVWLLDESGAQLNNKQLAHKLTETSALKENQLYIIIGGAYGVNESVKNRVDFIWSLSKLVFPHQMVRLLLIEQIYRSTEISKGSSYHHT